MHDGSQVISSVDATPASGPDGAAAQPPRRADRVNALMHGLAILQMYSDEAATVTVSDMARHIGVHRSSASRLAATLHSMGFLDRTAEAGQYRLGPQLVRLGRLAAMNNDLVQQALGPLRRLVEQCGETGHVGVLDGTDAVTVGVVDGWHTVRMHGSVNKRAPAYCSSLGKSLLSGLSEAAVRQAFRGRRLAPRTANTITSMAALLRELDVIRDRGFALDNEELELGLRCVAAPIQDADGNIVASLGLSGPALRLTDHRVHELSQLVMAAAAQASTAIGGAAKPVPPQRTSPQRTSPHQTPPQQTPPQQTPPQRTRPA